jgi:hypothetical protein
MSRTQKQTMSKYKKRIVILLLIQTVLMVGYLAFWERTVPGDGVLDSSWHFWVVLGFGAFSILYAFSLCCPNPTCRRRQVFRGWSISDLRLPEESCYYCGVHLTAEYKNGRSVEP